MYCDFFVFVFKIAWWRGGKLQPPFPAWPLLVAPLHIRMRSLYEATTLCCYLVIYEVIEMKAERLQLLSLSHLLVLTSHTR